MTRRKIRVLSVFLTVALVGMLIAAIYAAGLGFARGGGQIAAFSPSVEVQADSIGDITTVSGIGNSVIQSLPTTPESATHRTGELLGAAFWFLLDVALIGGVAFAYLRYRQQGWAMLQPQLITIEARRNYETAVVPIENNIVEVK